LTLKRIIDPLNRPMRRYSIIFPNTLPNYFIYTRFPPYFGWINN